MPEKEGREDERKKKKETQRNRERERDECVWVLEWGLKISQLFDNHSKVRLVSLHVWEISLAKK